jgi:predicted DNA-binding antitoxin AbrB/MazE fold protein
MTAIIDATFANGVFTPDAPLPLPEQSRVRITVESIQSWTPELTSAAWESIQARLIQHPIHGGGIRFTRDELHERD